MNPYSSKLKERVAAVSLLLGLIALVALVGVRSVWDRYASNRELIADLEQRVTRFESIATRQAALEQQLAAVQGSMNLSELTLPGDSATLAAADLQEQVKAAVQEAGGSLTSTQILEPEKVSAFDRVAVNVRMTGSTPAVQKSLHALESGRPILMIDNLLIVTRRTTVRMGSRRSSESQDWLDVRFKVSGYYQAGPGGS